MSADQRSNHGMEWKLFYDGGCNLCHASQLRAERWAKAASQPLRVDVLVSDEALRKGYGDLMTLEADGKVYFASEAWLKIMTIAPWYLRGVSWFGLTAPTRWIAAGVYRFVARIRYRLFGVRSCPVPGKA